MPALSSYWGMEEKLQSRMDRPASRAGREDEEPALPVAGRRRTFAVTVGPRESREYVLTNKEKAYFTGETGTANGRSYNGLIVELHKFLEGWDLLLGGRPLSSWGVRNACVLPQSMTREHVLDRTTETVFLADGLNLLILTFSTNYRGGASFVPRIDIRGIWEEKRPEYETCWCAEHAVLALRRVDHPERTMEQDYPVWIAIACDRSAEFVPEAGYRPTTYTKDAARRAMATAVPYVPGRLEFRFEEDPQFPASATFSIAVGDSLDEAVALAARGIAEEFGLYDAKMRRISATVDGLGLAMRDRDYRYSLMWAAASVDALVMNQMGRGIFAGLHWFPNYWGRDTFISLPGACLVRGDFETARGILETFAGLQDTVEGSRSYGRVPNLAMPGEVHYNTADATWWFVREACEFLRYTGDVEFAERILPVVKRAIDGALTRRVGEDLLLRHGEAETWMDAGGEERPLSPRGDRAVEVEALWYTALRSGAAVAAAAGTGGLAERWNRLADRVRSAFVAAFWDDERSALHDHLDPDGTPDGKVRPNQILAASVPWDELLSGELEERMIRFAGDSCVLPHGVASLAPSDPDFHPRHLDLERYHFDEAYHNGDVWVWLTGPVVTAFVKRGLVGRAWEQTVVVRDLMFDEGAAGTLPELRNGVPPESGENVAGAVSQAWSLSEFLRNFYQDYLGVAPNLLEGVLHLRPALPRELGWVSARAMVGGGAIRLFYRLADDGTSACYRVSAERGVPRLDVRFRCRVPPAGDVRPTAVEANAELGPGGVLEFVVASVGAGWTVDVERLSAPPERGERS